MAVRILIVVAVLLGDSPESPSYLDLLLDTTLGFVGVAVLILLVSAAVLLTVLYLIRWLLSESRLNWLGSVLAANWLRPAWIGVGVLFFVMVVVPGALLIYQYSGIGD
jgi:hypothetical protein